jgi:hypothetical protein
VVGVEGKTTTVGAVSTTAAEAVGIVLLGAGVVGLGLACWWAGCLLAGAVLLAGSWLASR